MPTYRLPMPEQSGDQVKDIQDLYDAYYKLRKELQFLLSNLDSSNVTELDGNITTFKNLDVSGTIITNTLITQNLYAELGWIARLTVDHLITADFLKGLEEFDYIDIEKQYIKFIHAYRKYTDGVPDPDLQYTTEKNEPLWWEDETNKNMIKTPTDYPVMVHPYNYEVKMSLMFVEDQLTGYMVPKIIFGIGSDPSGLTDNGKAFLHKHANGFIREYNSIDGKKRSIDMDNTGIHFICEEGEITGLPGLSQPITNVDFYNDGLIATYLGGSKADFSYTKDEEGKIIRLVNNTQQRVLTVNWSEANKP